MENQENGKNLAIASTVIGIVTLLFSFIPIWNIISILSGIAGIICGAMARKKADESNRGVATLGLILSIVGLVLSIIIFAACGCVLLLAMAQEGYYSILRAALLCLA